MGQALYQRGDLDTTIFRSGVAAALGYPPRNMYFVNSATGSSANTGIAPSDAMATLAQAIVKCANNSGDCVVVMAGHAETLSATTVGITISQSGVAILGMGDGASRPAFTCGAANIHGVLLSGNNNRIQNLQFTGSTSQTTSSIFSVTGTGNAFINNDFNHGGAGPLRCISMTGATRTRFIGNSFLGTAAGPDVGIYMTSACSNSEFRDNIFNYQGSAGLDSAAIFGSAGVAHAGLVFTNNVGLCMDLAMFDINGSHASISLGDSLMAYNYSVGSAAQTVANTYDAGGSQLACNWVSDAVASAAVATGAQGAMSAGLRIPAGSTVA